MTLSRTHAKYSLLVALALSCALSLLSVPASLTRRDASPSPRAHAPSPPSTESALEAYGRLPLSFEANRGQTASEVDFLARGDGYTLFLKPTEAVLQLRNAEGGLPNEFGDDRQSAKINPQPQIRNPQTSVLRMKLEGANGGAAVEGSEEFAGKVNYFHGDDPARWRTDVPTFGRVRYGKVYPGVDLVYYGNQRQLEYDFVVAPGADARAIALRFEGADALELGEGGDLVLKVGESTVRQPKPFVYQEVAGERRAVEGGYVLDEGGRVRFSVGEYDARLPLVIDPVLVYSTYLGGSGDDSVRDLTVDPFGNLYMCGETTSTNFPTASAFDATFNTGNDPADRDAFVAKLNATGTALVYSTYLGGTGTNVNLSGDDVCTGIAIDSAGNAYLAGETRSTDFPLANAFDTTFGGAFEGYLTKLNAAGNALVYSTYIGGDTFDSATSVAVDSSNNPYVAGRTTSSDFPTLNPIQATFAGGGSDAFVMKFNAAGSALVYSTYLGGGGGNGFDAAFGIALDPAGNAYITGPTISTDFPTLNPIQATFGGGTNGDGFVAKINAAGSALVYSTYLGGSGNDLPQHIIADSSGNAYVTGGTESPNFTTANAFDSTLTGTSDAFVTKLNPTGSAFVYSTYLGGAAGDGGNDIRVDSSGNAHVAGFTASTDFPTLNPTQAASAGSNDAFVTEFNAAGSALTFSTYLGGSGTDSGFALALDSAGSIYVAGITLSTNFPTLGPVQAASGGGEDAFVTKISDTTTTLQFNQASYPVQEDVTFVNFTVTRTGDTTTAVNVDYATSDGTANERGDYTTALGTIRFAANQTQAVVPVLISEDSFAEGTQAFNIVLLNPTNGASLGAQATATVEITDDAVEPATNAIDDASIFVGQHYHDFLHRQSDPDGQAFWTAQINACGADATCVAARRANVSTAFFLSIEFQQTGYFVIRTHKAAFGGDKGIPRYRPFLRDQRQIGEGVVFGDPGSGALLEANRQRFLEEFVSRSEFVSVFPVGTPAATYVDTMFANAGVTPTAAERSAAIAAYGAGDTAGRAAALRSVADSDSVYVRQYNPAFVLMQYFGYLRRNPNDPPDVDFRGYDFWLAKLDSFSQPGENVRDESVALARVARAQMVEAFITSIEYRNRFGD